MESVNEDFEIVSAGQLDLPNPDQFAFRYDVMEFSTAIKPFFFRWLFRNTRADKIIFLDPDILVLSPLTKVLDLLEQGATAVLTPHLTERVDDGFHPDELTMLRVGVYNLGFIGLARGCESTSLVNWWCDRLERGAVVDLKNGLFTDQKWADLMPCLFDRVAILRNPGYNVAYWNLMHRKVNNIGGEWFANEETISFVHFSGIDPHNPVIFSKHQNRYSLYSLQNVGELKVLYEKYLELLKSNGYFESVEIAYGHGRLADGTRIHPAMRTYFRRFLDTGPGTIKNPFTTLRYEYLNEIEPSLGGNSLISRFMYGLYLHQRELQGVFHLENWQVQARYADWFIEMASAVYGVDETFVAAARKRIQASGDRAGAGSAVSWRGYIKKWLSARAHQAYRWNTGLALAVTRRLPSAVVSALRTNFLQGGPSGLTGNQDGGSPSRLNRGHSKPLTACEAPGVTLIGYARGEFGIAEILRYVAGALTRSDYPFDIFGIDTGGRITRLIQH